MKFVVLDVKTLHSDDIGPVDIILVDEIHSPVVHPCKEWVMQLTQRWWLQQTAIWVQDTVSGNGDVLVVVTGEGQKTSGVLKRALSQLE